MRTWLRRLAAAALVSKGDSGDDGDNRAYISQAGMALGDDDEGVSGNFR